MIDSALPERQGLYNPANEHDACGVGFVAHIKGGKSHSIVEQGLQILKNLDHRGAVGADPLMGDGAGILIQIPHDYFHEVMAAQGVTLPRAGDYGVGMVFLPKESASRLACQEEIERAVRAEGQVVLGWRDVPVNHTMPMSPAVPDTDAVLTTAPPPWRRIGGRPYFRPRNSIGSALRTEAIPSADRNIRIASPRNTALAAR